MSKQTNKQDNLPTINIKGAEYVLVKDRVLHFHEVYPKGSIKTEVDQVLSEFGRWVVKATVTPDTDTPERVFTGYSQASADQSMVNKTAALENAETSAVGRALAMMGIGVIDSVASADEMRKAGVPDGIDALSGINPKDVDEVLGNKEPLPWENLKCETCGAPAVHKTGTSAKTNKDWEAIFCSTGEKSHAKFL